MPGNVVVRRSGGRDDAADLHHPTQRRNHNTRHHHGAPRSATTRHDLRASRHGGLRGANSSGQGQRSAPRLVETTTVPCGRDASTALTSKLIPGIGLLRGAS